MKWPVAFIAALKRRLACALPVPDPRSRPTCATNTCHTAPRMKPKHLPAAMPDLALRAHRLHNRNSKAAERYLRLHLILSKGVCSNE